MTSLVYDAGSLALQRGLVDFLSEEIQLVPVKSTYTPSRSDTHSVLAAAEISGVTGHVGGFGGAGRQVLGSKTLTNDPANHRTVYDAADPAPYVLGVGETIGGVIVMRKGVADDSTAVLLFFNAMPLTITNGSVITLAFAVSGIGFTQQ